MKRLIALILSALAASVAAPSLASADVALQGGTTTLAVDSGTAAALTEAGIAVAPIGPADARAGGIAFPITGGAIDPPTAAGAIEHAGGLRLSSGNTTVRLTDFTVTVSTRSRLTASVGGARVPILDLDTAQARITRDGLNTTASNLKATLTSEAAGALNEAFSTTLFKRGIVLGTVVAATQAAEGEVVEGATSLTLEPSTAAALQSLGVTPGVVAPATAGSSGLTFPIVSPKVGLVSFDRGEIAHSGGITLTAGATTVALTNFAITGEGGPARLVATVGGARVPILNLDIGAARFIVNGQRVVVQGIGSSLTGAAAGALNQAFGTTAFAAGLPLGPLTADARFR